MKVKLGTLLASARGLAELQNQKLPIGAAFVVLSVYRTTAPAIQTAEDRRVAACKKYGYLATPDAREYSFAPGKREALNDELDALFAEEVEVDCRKIRLDELGDCSLSAAEIAPLADWLIDTGDVPVGGGEKRARRRGRG